MPIYAYDRELTLQDSSNPNNLVKVVLREGTVEFYKENRDEAPLLIVRKSDWRQFVRTHSINRSDFIRDLVMGSVGLSTGAGFLLWMILKPSSGQDFETELFTGLLVGAGASCVSSLAVLENAIKVRRMSKTLQSIQDRFFCDKVVIMDLDALMNELIEFNAKQISF